MKNILFFLLVMIEALTAQTYIPENLSKKYDTDLETAGLKGAVKEVTQTLYSAKEKRRVSTFDKDRQKFDKLFRKPLSRHIALRDFYPEFVAEFNSSGFVNKIKELNTNDTHRKLFTFKYAGYGRVQEILIFNFTYKDLKKGNYREDKTSYKYNSSGLPVEIFSENSYRPGKKSRELFKYNEQGDKIMEKNIDSEGKTYHDEIREYEYSGGMIVKEKIIMKHKKEEFLYRYKYDKEWKIVEKKKYDKSGELIEEAKYGYDFDGRPESYSRYNVKQDVYRDNEQYRYDELGNLIARVFLWPNGKPQRKYSFSFDQNNHLVYFADNSMSSGYWYPYPEFYIKYKNDDNGNWTEKKIYASKEESSLLYIFKRKIQYYR